MTAGINKKILIFGLLGAAGCFAGWVVGEVFLLVALPSASAQQVSGPSLVTRPSLPDPLPPPPSPPSVPPAAPVIPVPPPPPPEFRERLDKAGGKTGDVQISLLWDNVNDLDLHCIDPSGEEIYYGHKRAASAGELDVDRNAGGPETNSPVENIYWPPGRAPVGRYRVYIHHFAGHGGRDPTAYRVNVLVGSQRHEFKNSISHGQAPQLAWEFEVGATLRLALPEEIVVNAGSRNQGTVKIVRERFSGPVTLDCVGDVEMLNLSRITIPQDSTDGQLSVIAEPGARGGTRVLRVIARGPSIQVEAPLKVSIKVPPPMIRLALPGEVSINAGNRNEMKVLIARDRCSSAVTLRCEGDLEGLSFPEVVIPAERTEADIVLTAASSTREGVRNIKVLASCSEARAEDTFRLTVGPALQTWSWLMVYITGLWTALLAVGLVLALVAGQNRSLGRSLLPGQHALVLAGGGALAGLVAGGIGQTLLGLLSRAGLPQQIGFVAGWVLLGLLLGRGVGFFVPNLNALRASLAGGAGGLVGALAFLAVSLVGNLPGRLMGAVLLGGAIGLMVALVEMAFRKAWLEVVYGPHEVGTVNLGEAPVSIGGDGRACTVLARGAAPVAFRYRLSQSRVLCEDVVKGQTLPVPLGHRQKVGPLEVIVRGSAESPAPAASLGTDPLPATPVLSPDRPYPAKSPSPDRPCPAVAPSPSPDRPYATVTPTPDQAAAPPKPLVGPATKPARPAATGDACPGCGRQIPGKQGLRYCVVCERTF